MSLLASMASRGRMPRARTRTTTIKAPIRGWNTRDSIADMKPGFARTLDNYYPDNRGVTLRNGYDEHATGAGSANVESLLVYNGLSASEMFAAGGGAIYDATGSGAVGSAVVSGLSGNRWQYVNIGTAGGQFLFAVNGEDAPRSYDGTSWATPSITGVTAANLVWCNLHQRRIFFGEKNSLEFAYLAVNSIAGAASTFSLAGVARKGGYIMGMATWTFDAGYGMDDHAVFVTSEGECIVYRGIDPSTAADWQLVGVYEIGKPLGRRFFLKYGGDAVLVTEDGFIQMAALVSGERQRENPLALSDAISPSVNASARSNGTRFGWQPIFHTARGWLLFNVPQSATTAHQYVYSVKSKGWCRFTGLDAFCWAEFNGAIYFGGAGGVVYKADTGQNDNGSDIVGDIQPAFSFFGNATANKLFKLARPIWEADGSFTAAFDMNTDYDDQAPLASPTFDAPASMIWDVSNWDEAVWASGDEISAGWQSVTGEGFAGALRIRTASQGLSIKLLDVAYVFEEGGTL